MPNPIVLRRTPRGGAIPIASAVALATAYNWADRVVLNGGAMPSQQSIFAQAIFWDGLIKYSLLSKMITINAIAPDSAIAMATPLLVGPGNGLWTTVGSLDLTRDGVQASAANSYLRTGVVPSTAFNSNADGGITAYVSSRASWMNNHYALGANLSANPNEASLHVRDSTNSRIRSMYPSTASDVIVSAGDFQIGYFSHNTTASDKHSLYFKGPRNAHSEIATDVNTDANALPAFELFALGRNVSGSLNPANVANKTRFSFFAMHDGLTTAESSNFCLIIEALRRSLGGGFQDATGSTASVVVNNYDSQVRATGGPGLKSSTKAALTTFWNALIAGGIADKMIAVLPIPPDGLQAAITPLFHTHGNATWINNNFVAGDLTVDGLIGNGSTKYLQSHLCYNDRYFPANDIGMTYYDFTGTNESKRFMGSTASGLVSVQFSLCNFNGTAAWTSGDLVAGSQISAALANFKGYLSGNRVANNDTRIFRANSSTAHGELVSGTTAQADRRLATDTANTVTAWATMYSGAPQEFSNHRISFIAVHRGLTLAESATFYNAIQALRTAFGGGFV